MNKKEILEVRKQLTPERTAITKICGCYVNADKEKQLEFSKTFLALEEEEMFKYFDIFKKTLSGKLGKNLFSMEYSISDEDVDTPHEMLMELYNSQLEDETLLSAFYDKVIASYNYAENYFIVIIRDVYDIPGKASDGFEMEDASDSVYDHMICGICPVKLSKPGLSYNTNNNDIESRIRDWVVEAPLSGFLFPSFTDRQTDIHSLLYYSKMPEDLKPDFLQEVLGFVAPLTASDQKDAFDAVVSDTLLEACDFDVVKNIHENIMDMMEEVKDEPTPLTLTKTDVKKVLEKSGVNPEALEDFEAEYDSTIGENEALTANNITNTGTFEIKSPDIVVKVNPARTDLVDVREVDGRKCLVIEINDSLFVNGIDINK
ncbi:MAG TPA: DUF4317 domain-containing protein [Candidatus Dorea intestinavium]|nr:DUF4317 domain-containing protein [Candidatus Dorea intestinavium]